MYFFIGRGEVAEEEGHPYQLDWQNFAYGSLPVGEGVCRDN